MSLAETYKKAQEIVFKKYNTEPDKLGRSQAWKVLEVEEYRKTGKENSIMDAFVRDISETVEKLISETPVTKTVPTVTVEKNSISTTSIPPVTPKEDTFLN